MVNKLKQAVGNFKLKKQRRQYSESVREYLNANRDEFLSKWSELCEKTSGRISYQAMMEVLGTDFPKVPWAPASDKKTQIINFFMEIGIEFKADDTHLYFP